MTLFSLRNVLNSLYRRLTRRKIVFFIVVALLFYGVYAFWFAEPFIPIDKEKLLRSRGYGSAEYSSMECRGSQNADEWRDRVCLLRNVCYIGGKLHYYMEKGSTLTFDGSKGKPFFPGDPYSYELVTKEMPYRKKWSWFSSDSFVNPLVSLNAYFWNNQVGSHCVAMDLTREDGAAPQNVPWTKPEHYYFYSKLEHNHNFGHVLSMLFSWFRALAMFGLDEQTDKTVYVVSTGPCESLGQGFTVERCKHNWKTVLKVNDQDLMVLKSFGDVCFQNMLVGAGPSAMFTSATPTAIAKMRRYVRRRLHMSEEGVNDPDKQVICLMKKHRARRFDNFDEVQRMIETEIDAKMRVLENLGRFDFRGQIEAIEDCSVLVTVHGALGLIGMFMRPPNAVVVSDIFHLDKNKSVTFDGPLWDHSGTNHIRYKYGIEDVVINCTKAEVNFFSNKFWIYRNCGSVRVDLKRLKSMIISAMEQNKKTSATRSKHHLSLGHERHAQSPVHVAGDR